MQEELHDIGQTVQENNDMLHLLVDFNKERTFYENNCEYKDKIDNYFVKVESYIASLSSSIKASLSIVKFRARLDSYFKNIELYTKYIYPRRLLKNERNYEYVKYLLRDTIFKHIGRVIINNEEYTLDAESIYITISALMKSQKRYTKV